MDRLKFGITLIAALCTLTTIPFMMASGHSETPEVSEDPASDDEAPGKPSGPEAGKRETIEEWRKRRFRQPRPPATRPPVPGSNFN